MVSVILPSYNHAAYLKQRIDSILSQTYTDFELIVLDDKSLDTSRDIINEYRFNPHISHIIFNEENSGSTFKQWQKGIALAKGEYIWIAESDDYADSTFLEKVMESIHKHNSILCFSQSYMVDKDDKTLRSMDCVLKDECIAADEFPCKYMLYENVIYNASMVVFRKDATQNIDWSYLMQFKYCGDWYFWSQIMNTAKGTISEVKAYLNCFRIHNGNVTNRSENLGLSFLEGFQVAKQNSKKLNKEEQKFFKEKWYQKWLYYRIHFSFSGKTNLKILRMFTRKQPLIAYFEVKKQVRDLFK